VATNSLSCSAGSGVCPLSCDAAVAETRTTKAKKACRNIMIKPRDYFLMKKSQTIYDGVREGKPVSSSLAVTY